MMFTNYNYISGLYCFSQGQGIIFFSWFILWVLRVFIMSLNGPSCKVVSFLNSFSKTSVMNRDDAVTPHPLLRSGVINIVTLYQCQHDEHSE